MLTLPEFRTAAPHNRAFGIENELSRRAQTVVRLLHDEGVCEAVDLHEYHCDCSDCEVDGVGHLFHAQHDCTCDGEIISSILEYGSGRANQAFEILSKVLRQARAEVETDAGFHVHVDKGDLSDEDKLALWQMFARYQDDLALLASGRFNAVRGYNRPFNAGDKSMIWSASHFGDIRYSLNGTWLVEKEDTIEFRLWNATRAEWRMRMNVGISTGMVEAIAQGVRVTHHDIRTFDEVIFPHLDAATWTGIIRQREMKDKQAN